MVHPPMAFQAILWSTSVDRLDIRRDKGYIIHQLLSHGTLDHVHWLFQTYAKDEILHVFQQYPYKDYRASRFHLVAAYLLRLQPPLDERLYVKNIPRVIG